MIEGDANAKPDDPRSAGLFHTAFLLPSRADLGRWIKHAIDKQIPIEGASDHLVSEALYLTDPEGNGIEIYVDRPPEACWIRSSPTAAAASRARSMSSWVRSRMNTSPFSSSTESMVSPTG